MCDFGDSKAGAQANGLFNMACDAICFFQAPQVVRIHDRKFGVMHRVLQFALVGFIIYHIVWLMDFRETTSPYGAISVEPKFAQFGGNNTPTYCIPGHEDNLALEYTASNFANEQPVTNLTCRQFSSHEVVETNELYTSIVTRLLETHTVRSNCSEYGTQCTEVDTTKHIIVPNVEEGVFEIEHEVTHAKFIEGHQKYSKGKKSNRMKRENKHVLVETDVYYEHPVTHKKKHLKHYNHGEAVQITFEQLFKAVDEYAPNPTNGLYHTIDSLNPKSLPDEITGEQPKFRTTGAEFILDFEYSNKWHKSIFDEHVTCRAYIKHVPMQVVELGEKTHYVNYPNEVYTWETFGVLVSFHEVQVRGDVAFWSWEALVNSIVNYFVLFAVVTLIVQVSVFFLNPCKDKKALYALARRRDCHTPKAYQEDMELVHKDSGFSDYIMEMYTSQEYEEQRLEKRNSLRQIVRENSQYSSAPTQEEGPDGTATPDSTTDESNEKKLVITRPPMETELGNGGEGSGQSSTTGSGLFANGKGGPASPSKRAGHVPVRQKIRTNSKVLEEAHSQVLEEAEEGAANGMR